MSPTTFSTGGTGSRAQPPTARWPHGPGDCTGTPWRPADLSAKQVRWVLQALLLAAAFLLLMSFYTVVRGAVARGPAVLAAAPASANVPPADPVCDAAVQAACAQVPANAVLPSPATLRLVSFEPR